jgi:hypothetical protein
VAVRSGTILLDHAKFKIEFWFASDSTFRLPGLWRGVFIWPGRSAVLYE